jgi:hypothetical protein
MDRQRKITKMPCTNLKSNSKQVLHLISMQCINLLGFVDNSPMCPRCQTSWRKKNIGCLGMERQGKITEMPYTNLKSNSKQVLHLNAEYWRVLDW